MLSARSITWPCYIYFIFFKLYSNIILEVKFDLTVQTQMSLPAVMKKYLLEQKYIHFYIYFCSSKHFTLLWQSPASRQCNSAALAPIYLSHKFVEGAALPPELLSRTKLSQFNIVSQSARARHGASVLLSCDLVR